MVHRVFRATRTTASNRQSINQSIVFFIQVAKEVGLTATTVVSPGDGAASPEYVNVTDSTGFSPEEAS